MSAAGCNYDFIKLRTSNLCCFNLSLLPTTSKELGIAHQNIEAYTWPGSCNLDNSGQWLSYRQVKLNNFSGTDVSSGAQRRLVLLCSLL